ncbi:membrane protein [Pilimelia anulata]|uniref:Membrane protein n=1 Tax=Pilimelia anulata TaxID=53371 RepID=A0A8J3FFL7_9ACTN|nr:phage holin family protein [Pilimelia anulata]GGK05468.1 membrane protein [Pilimelia anulata]
MALLADTERRLDPESTASLIQRATEQVSTLVRDELALAKLELAEKGKRAGLGAGLFAGAGVLALYGVAGLCTAATFGLVAAGLPAWLAALIVGGALLLLAGVALLIGRAQLRRAAPPVPTGVLAGVRADIDTVTDAFKGHP